MNSFVARRALPDIFGRETVGGERGKNRGGGGSTKEIVVLF